MRKRKNHLSALAGSTVLFLVVATAFDRANAAPTQKVNVVNTPNVTVANPSTNAVAVRGVDNPAFQPFHALRVEFLNTGQAGKFVDLVAVPAGKRAVIETVTVETQLPSGQKPQIMIITTSGGTSVNHWVTLTPQPPEPAGGKDSFSATLSMRLYADPMTSIQFFLGRVAAGYTGDNGAEVTISGYYVDVP
jgi:hypothetical protein